MFSAPFSLHKQTPKRNVIDLDHAHRFVTDRASPKMPMIGLLEPTIENRQSSTPEPVQRQFSANSGGDTPTDPIGTSRLPGAKPSSTGLNAAPSSTNNNNVSGVRKKPEVPPKPILTPGTKKEHPEWMSFSEKKRHFEKSNSEYSLEQRSESRMSSTSTSSSTKQIAFLSPTELEKLKPEEAKARILASFGPKELEDFDAKFEENNGLHEEFTTVQETESRKIFRTAKAEKLYHQRMGIDVESEEYSQMSPQARKALEAEKRREWRQARLKSIEDDPMMSMMSSMKSFEHLDLQAKQDQIDEVAE